ncbi:MAG TPA: hypothetical protein VGF99_14445 [Myxococcota bacterium]
MIVRLLVGLLLLSAPMAPGFWRISLAERSEEHHEVESSAVLVGRVQRGHLVQPPPPAHRRLALRARRRRQRPRLVRRRRPQRLRSRRHRRVARRVFYGDDDDPDPDDT